MNKESKFKLERIIDQAVKEAYDIGFEDGRTFQGDLITQGLGDVAEALVDSYKKEGREKARKPGHWILVHPLQENDNGAYICSNCGRGDWDCDTSYDYCPFCGDYKGGDEQ